MGIAWFDDEPPPPAEVALRTGGVPLMPADAVWPQCPRCALPMLFRAQVPLALTSLVASTDDRLLLIFECHVVTEEGPCDAGEVLVGQGILSPYLPPAPSLYDVVIDGFGPRAAEVMRIAAALVDPDELASNRPPIRLLRSAPASIAREAVRAIEELQGIAHMRASAPTTLPHAYGGRLFPFDDAIEGVRRTTLPPLHGLLQTAKSSRMRGLFGGATPGYRDHSYPCACGKPSRTALRLLGMNDEETEGVQLGPAVVQVCLRCSVGTLYRSGSAPPSERAEPHPSRL